MPAEDYKRFFDTVPDYSYYRHKDGDTPPKFNKWSNDLPPPAIGT